MVKSHYIGDGHPTFNKNPYNGYYINPYYWVDDHPLLYGNNGSLDPGTYRLIRTTIIIYVLPKDPAMSLESGNSPIQSYDLEFGWTKTINPTRNRDGSGFLGTNYHP